jgi:hypothetical protein
MLYISDKIPAEGMVPPVVVLAVMAHPGIDAVLTVCGFANVVDCMSIINNEGFQLIVDFGVLEDKNMFEMFKPLGNCMVAAGPVNVGAIQVKKLQALFYWVHDEQKHYFILVYRVILTETMVTTNHFLRDCVYLKTTSKTFSIER